MIKKFVILFGLSLALVLSGCASVPMASDAEDMALKKFPAPPEGMAGLYVYRDTFGGQALKKTVMLDDKIIGETANKVYFYTVITPGHHELATESEFGANTLKFNAEAGRNYYVEQHIKVGLFVGGASLEMVTEQVGQSGVLRCKLAQSF